jgi:hypothetical protein
MTSSVRGLLACHVISFASRRNRFCAGWCNARVRVEVAVVAAVAIGYGTAVASPGSAAATGPPAISELRGCKTRGEGRSPQKPPPTPGVRLGPLVIWPSVRGRSQPTSNSDWRYVVKAPVILPARVKVVLAIAPQAVSRAAFQSHRRGYVSAVRFEACRELEPAFAYHGIVGKLTGFPFAIGLTRGSDCIPMELWVDGRATPIRRVVPVGRRSC